MSLPRFLDYKKIDFTFDLNDEKLIRKMTNIDTIATSEWIYQCLCSPVMEDTESRNARTIMAALRKATATRAEKARALLKMNELYQQHQHSLNHIKNIQPTEKNRDLLKAIILIIIALGARQTIRNIQPYAMRHLETALTMAASFDKQFPNDPQIKLLLQGKVTFSDDIILQNKISAAITKIRSASTIIQKPIITRTILQKRAVVIRSQNATLGRFTRPLFNEQKELSEIVSHVLVQLYAYKTKLHESNKSFFNKLFNRTANEKPVTDLINEFEGYQLQIATNESKKHRDQLEIQFNLKRLTKAELEHKTVLIEKIYLSLQNTSMLLQRYLVKNRLSSEEKIICYKLIELIGKLRVKSDNPTAITATLISELKSCKHKLNRSNKSTFNRFFNNTTSQLQNNMSELLSEFIHYQAELQTPLTNVVQKNSALNNSTC